MFEHSKKGNDRKIKNNQSMWEDCLNYVVAI